MYNIHIITLYTFPVQITKKIKKCKTDQVLGLEWDNSERPESANLLGLYQAMTGKSREEIDAEVRQPGLSDNGDYASVYLVYSVILTHGYMLSFWCVAGGSWLGQVQALIDRGGYSPSLPLPAAVPRDRGRSGLSRGVCLLSLYHTAICVIISSYMYTYVYYCL